MLCATITITLSFGAKFSIKLYKWLVDKSIEIRKDTGIHTKRRKGEMNIGSSGML